MSDVQGSHHPRPEHQSAYKYQLNNPSAGMLPADPRYFVYGRPGGINGPQQISVPSPKVLQQSSNFSFTTQNQRHPMSISQNFQPPIGAVISAGSLVGAGVPRLPMPRGRQELDLMTAVSAISPSPTSNISIYL